MGREFSSTPEKMKDLLKAKDSCGPLGQCPAVGADVRLPGKRTLLGSLRNTSRLRNGGGPDTAWMHLVGRVSGGVGMGDVDRLHKVEPLPTRYPRLRRFLFLFHVDEKFAVSLLS